MTQKETDTIQMITRIVFVRIGENDVKTKEHEGNLRKNIKGN